MPGYQGIRIHSGNTPADTLGCLLPGKYNGTDVVNSRSTFKSLLAKINAVIKKEKIIVFIETKN